jgi:hypothetical protein
MSGYINRGTDARILGPWAGWVQSKLSFHSSRPPKVAALRFGREGHIAVLWPPFLSIAIPKPNGRYATFRAGWRWDHNWGRGGYVADVIVKLNMRYPVTP